MKIARVKIRDKSKFNQLALHPLQSWEWGEFRKNTGIEVVRLGKYKNDQLIETAQITIHPLPFSSWTVGYMPKGAIPSDKMLEELFRIGKKYNCIFIKIEPNIPFQHHFKFQISNFKLNIKPSPHPLFTKFTFQLDLTKSEELLLKNMHPKTRYNIKIAKKHGVTIEENNSDKTFQTYLELLMQTTKRQKFYAHSKHYHKLMWETLKPAKIAHLLTASYEYQKNKYILATWIVFLFNNILYYPYGASSGKFRNVMASNLMMWETIRFGKKKGAKIFDMWGSLGPNPNPSSPWYGFHRFKKGYDPNLVEFIGSFDLIINPQWYRLYNAAHKLREVYLMIKSSL